jgi:release factor glutamine methyltransferase
MSGPALQQGAAQLRAAGIENPRLEARLLLAHAIGITPEALLADPKAPIDAPRYRALLDRRARREPLALILGHREFWSLDFAVSPATLIPRPASETLVEVALAACADREAALRVLDLGTGTGCLLLAVLSERPKAFGIGVDIVPAAVALAARNAAMLGMRDRTAFVCGDWATPIATKFNLVLCNPPYIPRRQIGRLMPEIADHEPSTALDGGADGLSAYRSIIPALQSLLSPCGLAILEVGLGAAGAVNALAMAAGLTTFVAEDLAGIPRAVALRPIAGSKKPFGRVRRGG